MPVNPATKSGYTLIFDDDFGSFNSSAWAKSKYNPAAQTCAQAMNCPALPYNVLGSVDGMIPLRTHPKDINEPEEAINNCQFSSGEITTFSTSDPNFQQWRIYPNTFIEGRVRIPFCPGVGAAFWLYGVKDITMSGKVFHHYTEMDLFEVQTDDRHDLSTNFHYGAPPDIPRKRESKTAHLKDLSNDNLDYDAQPLTFGMKWEHFPTGKNKISVFMNNVCHRVLDFWDFDWPRRFEPMTVIFGTGPDLPGEDNLNDCNDFPQTFNLDYFRVFQENGTDPLKAGPAIVELCSGIQGGSIYTNHFPGITYEWTAPGFNIGPGNVDTQGDRHYWWATTTPNLPTGFYDISLKATFPSGFVQVIPIKVHVTLGPPPIITPSSIVLIPLSGGCYTFGIVKNPGTTAYKWKVTGGVQNINWKTIQNAGVKGDYNILPGCFYGDYHTTNYQVCVVPINTCWGGNTNAPVCQNFTLPKQGPHYGYFGVVAPEQVAVELNADSMNYHLTVAKSNSTTGYEWSYDQETWFEIANSSILETNCFGEYEPGTADFPISVRAYSDTLKSEIYGQIVHIPAPASMIGKQANPVTDFSDAEPMEMDQQDEGKSKQPQTTPQVHRVAIFNAIGQAVLNTDSQHFSTEAMKHDNLSGLFFVIWYDENGQVFQSKKVFIPQN